MEDVPAARCYTIDVVWQAASEAREIRRASNENGG